MASGRPLPHLGISEQDLVQSGQISKTGTLRQPYQAYLVSEYPRVQHRGPLVWGGGNPDTAQVVMIGEAPGEDENKFLVPFVGPAGQVLSDVLYTAGISRKEEVLIINTETTAPARDPSGRIGKPSASDVRLELGRVLEILHKMKERPQGLKAIVCMGKYSYLQLMGTSLVDECLLKGSSFEGLVTKTKMGPIMGWHDDPIKLGVPVLVAYHPSYILRQKSGPAGSWEDEANEYLIAFQSLSRRIHGGR